MRLTGLMLILCVALGGCMGATANQLQRRASFDLNCPAAKIAVVKLDKRTRGVRGCGKRVTYVEHCRACANGYPACDCTWVLNADARKNP